MTSSAKKSLWLKIKTWGCRPRVYTILWGIVALASILTKISSPEKYNNFRIFRQSFWHLLGRQDLYTPYPDQYNDIFLYGPLFGTVVAPFSVIPVSWLSMALWNLGLTAMLFYSIYILERNNDRRALIYWLTAHELLLALFMQQYNVACCALILLTFVAVRSKREGWAAFFLMLGVLTKIYGIVGLAFFPFARNKGKLILYTVVWGVVLGCLPMLVSSPEYVIGQYARWMEVLHLKSELNTFAYSQNISLLGIVRKVSGSASYSDLWVIVPMVILFALPYLRRRWYSSSHFQMLTLAQTLIYVVILSTGSESSGYITAMVGIAIWYIYGRAFLPMWLSTTLLIGALVLTTFSYSDLMPAFIRLGVVKPYALKALFPSIIALVNAYTLLTANFSYPGNQKRVAEGIKNETVSL